MRVALYARVSTKGQDPDNQLLRLEEYARTRAYEVVDKYIDTASGADAHRPRLDAMVRDAKRRRFDKVVCTKLDRLARSVINLSMLMADLEAWGVAVEFIDQPIDTSTPSGRLTTTVLAGVAEFERELIRDRTRDGLARARAEGRTGGRPRQELSDYQREKVLQILEEHPDGIPGATLASHFDGISRPTLLKLILQEGLAEKKRDTG